MATEGEFLGEKVSDDLDGTEDRRTIGVGGRKNDDGGVGGVRLGSIGVPEAEGDFASGP